MFIISPNDGQRRKETTQGWEILIQWKYGSTAWGSLKYVKESYLIQLAVYARQRKISDEPSFAWWIPHVLKKRKRIIEKEKFKYWLCTHTFFVRVPKMVEEAKRLDQKNINHLWWEAICK